MKLHKKSFIPLLLIIMCVTLLYFKPAKAASKVKLNRTKATISVGKTTTLKVKGSKKIVTWSTSKSSIATVSKKGVVTGKKAGTATITAKVGSNKLKCKVTVNPLISKKKLSIYMGEQAKLTVTGISKVQWSSSKKSIAKVKNGTVTALKPGKTTIKAKAKGFTLSCVVTVRPTKEYVATSYEELKQKILSSNYTYSDGNKAIYIEEILTKKTETDQTEQLKLGFYAIYEQDSGLFRFETDLTTSGIHIVSGFKLNPETVCNKKQPIYFSCITKDEQENITCNLSGTTKMDIVTYDAEMTGFSFDFVNGENFSEDEELLSAFLPHIFTSLNISAADLLVKEKLGLTLKDFGFITFENYISDFNSLTDLDLF